MKFRKLFSKKGLLRTALAILKIIENVDSNVVFIGLVILGIFCLGFDWYFKYEQLKSEERREIRKLELDAEIKIRKLELDAETQQSERKKQKKKKWR